MSVHSSTPPRTCPILVINLAGSTARWAKVSEELRGYGLAFERHEASDGRILTNDELSMLATFDQSSFFKPMSN